MSQGMRDFQETVWGYYRQSGRELPWRTPEPDGSFDPYKILVSEIMLQQTQATRVIPKYESFVAKFPTIESLASAPLSEVLIEWNGLGYNRRAKFLLQAAQAVRTEYTGVFPQTIDELVKLPGIGRNTAGAVVAYAYNQPVVYIETNIRTVFIHHFFNDADAVDDKELLPLVEAALDHEHAREWYWALMDYGVHIKTTVGNTSRTSKHYIKQSTFAGSRRQIRGAVIRLLKEQSLSLEKLQKTITDDRLLSVLTDLVGEGLVRKSGKQYML